MLKNLFALVGVAVVGMKAAELYVRFQELEDENAALKRQVHAGREPR